MFAAQAQLSICSSRNTPASGAYRGLGHGHGQTTLDLSQVVRRKGNSGLVAAPWWLEDPNPQDLACLHAPAGDPSPLPARPGPMWPGRRLRQSRAAGTHPGKPFWRTTGQPPAPAPSHSTRYQVQHGRATGKGHQGYQAASLAQRSCGTISRRVTGSVADRSG